MGKLNDNPNGDSHNASKVLKTTSKALHIKYSHLMPHKACTQTTVLFTEDKCNHLSEASAFVISRTCSLINHHIWKYHTLP